MAARINRKAFWESSDKPWMPQHYLVLSKEDLMRLKMTLAEVQALNPEIKVVLQRPIPGPPPLSRKNRTTRNWPR